MSERDDVPDERALGSQADEVSVGSGTDTADTADGGRMPDPAQELNVQLRALEARAERARKAANLPSSRRTAAAATMRTKYKVTVRFQAISAWLTAPPKRATVPSPGSSEQVLALVQVWSEWAGERPNERYWRDLLEKAQTPVRPVQTLAPGLETPSPGTAPVLRTLPRDVASFTGRDAELEQLVQAGDAGGVLAIYTVDGMAGVGKTALAVHAAHLLAGRFPDGQLFVRLDTHTPGRSQADPAAVLASLLTACGIPPQLVPDGLDARAAQWRDHLTGKRILLVLDDAADHEQIEPLLPGAPGCLVLITSRNRLQALDGAAPLPLAMLPPEQAALLFTRLSRRDFTEPELDEVAEIVALCGYLPLAVALLAGRLAHHPNWTLTQFTTDFTTARDLLGKLAAGNRAVATAFELSYRDLPADQQLLFRRLGLHPGPDTDAYAAAALAGIPLGAAERQLEALYTYHLVEESTPGRYRLHDLTRAYARALGAAAGDGDVALERLLNYYEQTAETADRAINDRDSRGLPDASGRAPELESQKQALTWLRSERANLLACIDHSTTHRQHSHLIRLTAGIAFLLRTDGPWRDAADLHQAAVTAARHDGDRRGQAKALNDLGCVRYWMGDFPEAARLQERALALYRELEDQRGEARVLEALGLTRYVTDEDAEAARLLEESLALYRELEDRVGEAGALGALSQVRVTARDYPGAVRLLEECLALYRELEDRFGEANALGALGDVRSRTDEHVEATQLYERALTMCRELEDRNGEAIALRALGDVRYKTHEYVEATRLYEQALTLSREFEDRLGEANSLRDLADTRNRTQDFAEAARLQEQALALYRELADRSSEAGALHALGDLRYTTHEYLEAAQLYEQALALYQELGDRIGEARVLRDLGRTGNATNDYAEATRRYEQVLAVYRELEDRRGEAEVLTSLGYIRMAAGDYPEGARLHEQALALFRDLGDLSDEARILRTLGYAQLLLEGSSDAARFHEQALALYRDLGDRENQARSLCDIGAVRYRARSYPEAVTSYEQAVALYRELGDRKSEADTLRELGDAQLVMGDYPEAARIDEAALALFRELGDRRSEANALRALGHIRFLEENYPEASGLHEQALALYRDIEDRGGEANALRDLGDCRYMTDDHPEAITFYEQALVLHQELGNQESETYVRKVLSRCRQRVEG
ncbi:tetratricopeptide repeat protein [Streptomyces sp. NPDC002812]|uniref:tetratricopeptide repeat protein n=1 Tax=Streptomyces sp. NPDC002812 TaxID=3154434 RepID=UPI0033265437